MLNATILSLMGLPGLIDYALLVAVKACGLPYRVEKARGLPVTT